MVQSSFFGGFVLKKKKESEVRPIDRQKKEGENL